MVSDLDCSSDVQLKCTKCGETTKDHVGVSMGVTYPVYGSKVPTHLCKKCKTCGRNAVIHMLPARSLPLTTGEEVKVMTFECHNCFPFDYVFGKEWNATPLDGKKLRSVNLRLGKYSRLTSEGLQVGDPYFELYLQNRQKLDWNLFYTKCKSSCCFEPSM